MLARIGDLGIHFEHDGFEFDEGSKPPHVFDLDARLSRLSTDARVIYLDRDPRDVVVSLFYEITGRSRDHFTYEGSISDFIRDEYFGAQVLAQFRAMWRDILAQRRFLHISYEDLHQDRAAVLGRVVSYIDAAVSGELIEAAAKQGDFESMRRIESEGQYSEPWLRLRHGFPKVRIGLVGSHAGLAQADIDYLNTIFEMG